MGTILAVVLGGAVIAAIAQEVPVVDGHLGPCSATFTVTGSEKKPIYDAKIEVVIRYGFMSLHKYTLQVGTNSEGKARVAGIPEKTKKPLEFRITFGQASKTVEFDPALKCSASFEVVLGDK
ncbi:MAG TPA: hypothetical protein VE398_14025 [Acidobacteriota bacterium]|nr:hypothetical protein [Acidobacteriota bacterium]